MIQVRYYSLCQYARKGCRYLSNSISPGLIKPASMKKKHLFPSIFKYIENASAKKPYRHVCTSVSQEFIQGQSPREGVREYFYFIDHQGQLFLEGTKIQNFVTCFKDKHFLVFFFKRLKENKKGSYSDQFPYVSRCGREMNYVRCESLPIVFTDIINSDTGKGDVVINGIGSGMTFPFQPEKLCMLPRNGRVYHPAPSKAGGIGILKTSLAIEFSSYFLFDNGDDEVDPPSHFMWKGIKYALTNELWDILKHENTLDDDEDS